jgi:type IV secretory pathway VirB3-like protein
MFGFRQMKKFFIQILNILVVILVTRVTITVIVVIIYLSWSSKFFKDENKSQIILAALFT